MHEPIGICQQEDLRRRQRLVVLAPAAMQIGVLRTLYDRRARELSVARLAQRARKIDPVQAEDDVRLADQRAGFGADVDARREWMQRVRRRKARRSLEIGDHACAETLGELYAAREALEIVRHAADEDQRVLRARERGCDLRDRLSRGIDRARRRIPFERGQRRRHGERFLLQSGIEADVHGTLRRRRRHSVCAQDRLERRGDRCGLVVPFRVVAHQRRHVRRRVDPVDPWPAREGVHRPDAAQHQHRNAIAPCIEDRHRRVHQADVRVQRDGERAPGDARVAVRQCHRAFLVNAQEEFRALVAEVVDEAVVQAAEARARRERDVGDVQRAQHLRHAIAAEARHRFEGGVRFRGRL